MSEQPPVTAEEVEPPFHPDNIATHNHEDADATGEQITEVEPYDEVEIAPDDSEPPA